MNIFLNLQQEFVLPLSFGATRVCQSRDALSRELSKMKRIPLQRRISIAGNIEQFNSRFLAHYNNQQKRAAAYWSGLIHQIN